MTFVERVGAAVTSPRSALAAAAAGRGGMPDALLLVALKIICTETRVLVVTLWMMVKVGPGPALAALSSRLSSVVGTDLLLLAGGGVVVTVFAGRRRDATRDFDLAAVAWIPVLFLDTAAAVGARIAGVGIAGSLETVLRLAMLGWMLAGCVLAVGVARRGEPAPAPAGRARIAGLVLLGALAALLAWNSVEIAGNVRELRPRGTGDDAPVIALRPLDPAGPRSLAELRGRVILVDFWATWCVPCRRSMPAIEGLWGKYKDQGLTVVSINVENDAAKASAFAAASRPRLDFPLFVDDGAAQSAFQVDSIPHLVLIDRHGRIDLVHVGGFDLDELGERIAGLLTKE